MTQDPQQPTKSARAADALDAMFRGEQASHDAPQVIDGVEVAGAASNTPADLTRADSTGASEPLSGAAGYSDLLGPGTLSAGEPAKRRRTGMSPSWRYGIPVLAGMATLMFLLAAWSLGMLVGWLPSKQSTFMVALLMIACLLFAVFFVFSCYVIQSELRRQEQNRTRAAQRTNPPAAP